MAQSPSLVRRILGAPRPILDEYVDPSLRQYVLDTGYAITMGVALLGPVEVWRQGFDQALENRMLMSGLSVMGMSRCGQGVREAWMRHFDVPENPAKFTRWKHESGWTLTWSSPIYLGVMYATGTPWYDVQETIVPFIALNLALATHYNKGRDVTFVEHGESAVLERRGQGITHPVARCFLMPAGKGVCELLALIPKAARSAYATLERQAYLAMPIANRVSLHL